MPDAYATLGVTRDADAAEIRRAYRVLAARVHPDLQPPARKAWAHAEMVRLNAARTELLNLVALPSRPVESGPTWLFAFGLWLCFILSVLTPFVAFSPDARHILSNIFATLLAAAVDLGPWAFVPPLAALFMAWFVRRTQRGLA